MVQTTPTPFDVGRAFVHQYYTLLHQAPQLLHRFYSTDSTFIHGGVDRPGSIEQPAVGPEDIARRIIGLNLRDCHAKIRQVDSHPTIGSGVVVQVTGELSNNGHPMRRFMQTFVLAPRQPKKYYVQNDIFRYQDEVFEDASDEDDGSSSQIYGDTDKVSNADSSAAVSQQPSAPVTAPTQPPVDEPQHQPLPPRNAGNQQSARQQQQETPVNGLNETSGFSAQQQQQQQQPQQPLPQQQPQQPTQDNQSTTKQTPPPTTTSTEGASYAGIAKLHSSAGPTSSVSSTVPVTVPPPQPISAARPSTAGKPVPNQQRGNGGPYQQNNRGNYWNDQNASYDQNTSRRPGGNTTGASNEQQVFVGSLPAEFTEAQLRDCFSQFGQVRETRIHRPANDYKKNYGFVIFEDPEIAQSVVKMEHVDFQNVHLNIEAKTERSYQGNANNISQGNGRNNNYAPRPGGMNRGGSRGGYRGAGNNPRRGGGQYYNRPTFVNDENYKAQQPPPQQQQQQQ